MPTVIDNPILNSAFREPTRHFRFDEEGITNDVVERRRTSAYFVPIAQPRKKGKQLQFETEWTEDRLEENRIVNLIRQRVGAWRQGGHVGVTGTTARLLTYWTNPDRVVGRGLRRMSYAANDAGMFGVEYAEVYGVPFSFIPTADAGSQPTPGPASTRVRALEERIDCELTFPRLIGYRYDIPTDRLRAQFTADSRLALSTADIPTRTENRPIVGETSIHTLDDLRKRRENEVVFLLAKLTLEKYFRHDGESRTEPSTEHRFDADVQAWLFPQLLGVTKRWLAECVTCKDSTFPQLLLLIEFAHEAADRIYKAIVATSEGTPALRPLLRAYDAVGSTRYVDFDTTKPVYATDPTKSHVSHVVADTGSWEQKLAETLEEMPEVVSDVKNQGLNFTIPCTLNGDEKQYYPDFIARLRPDGSRRPAGGRNVRLQPDGVDSRSVRLQPDGVDSRSVRLRPDGVDSRSVRLQPDRDNDLLLIIEVTGESRKDKAAKVSTARTLWIPAVNNHGGFGRWAFVEVTDPWDAQRTIRATVASALHTI